MHHYTFRIAPARQKSAIVFSDHKQHIEEALEAINGGIAFKRARKNIALTDIGEKEMIVTLASQEPLANPSRSLSALSRYLISRYPSTYGQYIYNNCLFNTHPVSQVSTPSLQDDLTLSNEEILKNMVDLLYTYPQTKEVQAAKAQITEIIKPFVGKRFDYFV